MFPIIKKLVNWFELQINWLVSINDEVHWSSVGQCLVMTKLHTNLNKPTAFSCDQVLKGKQYNIHTAVLEKYNALVFCIFSEKMKIQ